MSEWLSSVVCLVGGLLAIGIGLLMTRRRLQRVKRIHRKKGLIHAESPEGWGSWFFQGFSDVTMGTRWVVGAGILAFWMALGVSLLSLGLRLAWHP